MPAESLPVRLRKFAVALGACLAFVYLFLPMMTRAFEPLDRMSRYLDNNGIDPSRYYYTDVEQVAESELYLRGVLRNE